MRLAVFTSQIGTASETFIRRHVEDLAPGSTVVVARHSEGGGFWDVTSDAFFVDRWASTIVVRGRRRLGASMSRMRNRAISRFLRRHKIEIVLGEYLDQFLDFVPMLERMRLPFVVQGHGIDLSAALRRPETVERYGRYRSARAILTRCEFHRQRLIALGLPSEMIHVNPGGVDVPEKVPMRGLAAANRLLAIGRMVPKKGPMFLLEAFRQAAAQNVDISLDLVGDGPLLPAVRQFVAATGLERRVRLHGAAPESVKKALLAQCGVFAQHSLTDPESGDEEGLPAAIQEAMAYGMAVVSTRHSGISEAIDEGLSGLLVAEGESAAMAQAILRVTTPESYARQLGAAGRTRALELYSWPAERARLLRHLSNPCIRS